MTEHRGPPNARSRAVQGAGRGRHRWSWCFFSPTTIGCVRGCRSARRAGSPASSNSAQAAGWSSDRVMNAEELARLPPVEPVYGLTEGLLLCATVARAAEGALRAAAAAHGMDRRERPLELPGLRRRARRDAPPGEARRRRSGRPRRDRLAYDELLANRLALLLMRARHARCSRARAPRRRGFGPASRGRAAPFR